MSPPAARARRWFRPSMRRRSAMRGKTAPCSISAASPISPCCRWRARSAASTPGPGNGLMDAWTLRHRGERYDRGAAFALAGTIDSGLLEALLADPWLALPPPKSTGRDQFHGGWLDQRLAGRALAAADVQATLNAFTARSIADALRANAPACARLLVCGGGVHNPLLLDNLRRASAGRGDRIDRRARTGSGFRRSHGLCLAGPRNAGRTPRQPARRHRRAWAARARQHPSGRRSGALTPPLLGFRLGLVFEDVTGRVVRQRRERRHRLVEGARLGVVPGAEQARRCRPAPAPAPDRSARAPA